VSARHRRHGFTLVEVLAAMLIGGMVISAAAALFAVLSRRDTEITAITRQQTEVANMERAMRHLLEGPLGRGDSLPAVAGTPHDAAFRAWCETARGRLGICEVTLRLEPTPEGTQLTLVTTGAQRDSVALLWRRWRVRFAYLDLSGGAPRWHPTWAHTAAPAAVALAANGDTTLLRVGGDD
jgi:prepilin-type N-terminal cleavage/methylation domain-containing protein